MYIDSFFYGKTVIAPLGIILYNVFGKGGPNLYGEAKTRFHINMQLNVLVGTFSFSKKDPEHMLINYLELI